MLRKPILAALLLAAGAGPRAAQASAELFTRTSGDVVRAAVRIELEGNWHIYHKDLGHPNAVGQPTVVTFPGEGIEWSEVRFPDPVRLDQSDVAGPGTFIFAHEHELVLYAAGRVKTGASAEGLEVKVKGLVCEDTQGCVPFRQTLTSSGAGPEALFAAFPADLVAPGAPAAAPVSTPPAPEPAKAAESTPPSGGEQAAPAEDEIEKGEADTTLYTRVEGSEVRAALEIAITPGWHLYHETLGPSPYGKPTVITLHGEGITWDEPRWPEPIHIDQSEIEKGLYILGHEGTIVVYVRGTLAGGAQAPKVWGEIEGQTCEDVCIDYDETFVSKGEGPAKVWDGWKAAEPAAGAGSASSGATAAGTTPGAPARPASGGDEGLLAFLLLAIGGGLFALVMPCTYPMIPITISFFTKQADKRGGTPLSLSLAYGAGIVLIFVIVGVLFGSLIKPFSAHPVTNLVLGVAFVYFALVLFGALNLEPPRFLMNMAGTASARGGFLGVFLMGATLVVTSFTCTAPFVGSLLSIGASGGSAGRVALGMAVFGLTMAVPFVLLSLVPGRLKAMPRSGEWMNTVKVTLGFVELAAALKFISNADLVWHWGWLSREVFLTLWMGILGVAALYLFGMIHLKSAPAPISPGRMIAGLGFALMALYCWNGTFGGPMDPVMTALMPNYSTRPIGGGAAAPQSHAIVIDDVDAAVSRARAENKLVLLNFTGYT